MTRYKVSYGLFDGLSPMDELYSESLVCEAYVNISLPMEIDEDGGEEEKEFAIGKEILASLHGRDIHHTAPNDHSMRAYSGKVSGIVLHEFVEI